MDEELPKPKMAAPAEHGRHELSQMDEGFIRVLEDLIDVLISNGVIRLTDLPAQALDKLAQRKAARQRLRDANSLINDDEELI